MLWEAVKATQKRWPRAICVIYTGDHEATKAAMLERVHVSLSCHTGKIRAHTATRTDSTLNYTHQPWSSST